MNQVVDNKIMFQLNHEGELYNRTDRLIFQLSKDWIKILQWIDKGTSKDPARVKLQFIHATEKFIESTDGFVIHRAIFKDGKQIIPAGLYTVVLITKEYVILEPAHSSQEFVDAEALMNRTIRTKPKEISEYYSAVISIDPRLLARTLSIGNIRSSRLPAIIEFGAGPALITFLTNTSDLEETCGIEKFEALIMPMYVETKFTRFIPSGGGMGLVPKAAPETEEE